MNKPDFYKLYLVLLTFFAFVYKKQENRKIDLAPFFATLNYSRDQNTGRV